MTTIPIATVLAATALGLGLARLAIFLALHIVPSEYSIVRHAVSDYGVGPTRRLASALIWTSAVFWAVLAAALFLSPLAAGNGVAVWMLVLAGIFTVMPFLPTDLEGEPATLIGRLHLVAAVAWFAIAFSCTGDLLRAFQPVAPPAVTVLLGATRWVALASLIALVTALLVRPLRPYAFGISERIYLLAVSVFYLGTAGALLLL
ncbi:MAG: DUF998 domain-containing protein [Pseudoclavibacter sp.]|nr:DUF998 domain-containing protein [Pseudoclavibacter sp.]